MSSSTEIQYIEFRGQPIRTVMMDISTTGPELWYVAADVAAQMGHKKTGNFTRLVSSRNLAHAECATAGGFQMISVVSMAGIFEASSKSRSDFAAMLRDQVNGFAARVADEQIFPTPAATHLSVVPQAAPAGQVVSLDDMERLAAAVMQAVSIAREQQARADGLEANLAVVSSDLAAANRSVEVWTDGHAAHSMQQAAQWLASKGVMDPARPGKRIGRQGLFEYLREIGWICKGNPGPRQDAVGPGWAELDHVRIDGRLVMVTKITNEGLDKLVRRMTANVGTELEAVKEA